MTKMKKALSLALCSMIALGCSGLQNVKINLPDLAVAEDTDKPLAETYIGADFTSGGNNYQGEIGYELGKAIACSINTFECCIRMYNNTYTSTQSSVIFGNYNYYNDTSDNRRYINYEVNTSGNVVVKWAGEEYVFTGTDVRTGDWEHIAVVRDPVENTFTLYQNGVLVETSTAITVPEVTGNWYKQRIGGDRLDVYTAGFTTQPMHYTFRGEIGHVACYADALTQKEVQADYQDVTAVTGLNRDEDLLFSAMLTLGKNVVYDRSSYMNDATIMSYELFYDEEQFAAGDYSFAVMGDTQELVQANPQSLTDAMNWIVDNKTNENIGATLFLGDLTNGKSDSAAETLKEQWTCVRDNMAILDGKVPYIFIPGNHDYYKDSQKRDLTDFNTYLPYSKFAKEEHFAGEYQVGQMQNTYYTMTFGDVNYLFLALEFGPNADVMQWAGEVLAAYPNHRAVVMTHGFLDCGGEMYQNNTYLSADWYFNSSGEDATSSLEMWEKYLSQYSNVFMILSGHSVTESIAYKELRGEAGRSVMAFRIDPTYVGIREAEDSIIALFKFNEAEKMLYINYFSARKNKLYNVQNQMRIYFGDNKNIVRFTDAYYGDGGVQH
ncbi:MAG: metallophosphoesterase [Clostridia bacterium]|nr:metallophosphoesterase [Clostridia bacterium]